LHYAYSCDHLAAAPSYASMNKNFISLGIELA